MEKANNQIVLAKNDYNIIMSYLKNGFYKTSFDKQNAEELKSELKKAKLIHQDDLPADVVRLNSLVTIKEEKENKQMQLTLVTPEKADIKQKRISVLSPIGTALLGFKKGQRISWKVPAGKKVFTILDVANNL